MGRTHPSYCKHEHMIDGGDFYELDDITPCPKCAEEHFADELGVPALKARITELESKLQACEEGRELAARECEQLRDEVIRIGSRLEEAELDAKLLGEQGATLHVKLKAAESRLDAATKLLRDLQEDLNMRAVNKVVPIGATMWNRLCDFLVERQ